MLLIDFFESKKKELGDFFNKNQIMNHKFFEAPNDCDRFIEKSGIRSLNVGGREIYPVIDFKKYLDDNFINQPGFTIEDFRLEWKNRIPCPECGTIFNTKNSTTKSFCSKECLFRSKIVEKNGCWIARENSHKNIVNLGVVTTTLRMAAFRFSGKNIQEGFSLKQPESCFQNTDYCVNPEHMIIISDKEKFEELSAKGRWIKTIKKQRYAEVSADNIDIIKIADFFDDQSLDQSIKNRIIARIENAILIKMVDSLFSEDYQSAEKFVQKLKQADKL